MQRFSKWAGWLLIPALVLLYFTGALGTMKAKVQQGLLEAGFFLPEVSASGTTGVAGNYNLDLKTLDGRTVSLREMKNKVIFLNIWASWCPPCVAEMPGIQKLYQQTDTSQVAFVMLSVDEYDKALRHFLNRKKYTFPVYQAAGPIPEVYASPSIPITFVLNKDGDIVFRHDGMANYNTDEFREFLRKLAGEK